MKLIKRSDVENAKFVGSVTLNSSASELYKQGWNDAIDAILNNATVVEERPQARWEDCSNGWTCSNCYQDRTHTSKFCPNCGAKMENTNE